jgi:phage-related protein
MRIYISRYAVRSCKIIDLDRLKPPRPASAAERRAPQLGVALWAVQVGETPPIAKPLRGFGGAGVLELVEDDAAGTYRAIYTVRYETAIYVLHVFQKKSKRGRQTPKRDMELVEERLKRAAEIHAMMVEERRR